MARQTGKSKKEGKPGHMFQLPNYPAPLEDCDTPAELRAEIEKRLARDQLIEKPKPNDGPVKITQCESKRDIDVNGAKYKQLVHWYDYAYCAVSRLYGESKDYPRMPERDSNPVDGLFLIVKWCRDAEDDRATSSTVAQPASDQPKATEEKESKGASFLPGPLADSLGVSTETVKSHAEKVGVETPGVGKKNFRYPEKDMVLILNSMKMGSDRRLRKKAIERLESLDSPGLKSDGNTI